MPLPNRMALGSALRGAADDADLMKRDAARLPQQPVEMDAQLCCPKCKYCGPPEEFEQGSAELPSDELLDEEY